MVIVDKGDLFELAFNGHFDVIGHGVNCFCTQKSGIALPMTQYFETDNFLKYNLEHYDLRGDKSKLGKIDWYRHKIKENQNLYVVNMYTQYNYGTDKIHLDYSALESCLQKLSITFKNKRIGLPLIGGGLAGGDKNKIIEIMSKHDITLVLNGK